MGFALPQPNNFLVGPIEKNSNRVTFADDDQRQRRMFQRRRNLGIWSIDVIRGRYHHRAPRRAPGGRENRTLPGRD
jgi:hypothetical protein